MNTTYFKKNASILICALAGLILLLVIFSQFTNNYIHPDTLIYSQTTSNGAFFQTTLDFSGYKIPIDYPTALKPLSDIYVYFLFQLNIQPIVINGTLLALSFILILSLQKKTIKIILLIALTITYLFNGNVFYWANRYSAEFISIFLLALSITLLKVNKPKLFLISFVLLCLTRIEFLFILPFLLINSDIKPLWRNILLNFCNVYPFLVSLATGNFSEFISTIFIPFLFLRLLTWGIEHRKDTIINVWKRYHNKLKLVLLSLTLFYIIYLTYSLISSQAISHSSLGIVSAIALMFGLVIFYIFSIGKTIEDIKIFLIISLLMIIYLTKSIDSFRYLIFLMPLILYGVVINIEQIQKGKFTFIFLIVSLIQIGLISSLIPWDALKTNYWFDRTEFISTDDYKNYTVYSSTPLIFAFKGYTSKDICELSSLGHKTIIILDTYSFFKCQEEMNGLQQSISSLKPVYLYDTNDIVEIERYKSLGQVSLFYIFD